MLVNEYDYSFKILIIGDYGVGKSSLISRFVNNHFNCDHLSTLGVDFAMHSVNIDGQSIRLRMWDLGGQQRYRNITYSYYRGIDGVLIVYDITNLQSFNNVEYWLSEINRLAQKQVPCLLVGTKTDLDKHRAITLNQVQKMGEKHRVRVIETSSKNDKNIENCFVELCQLMKNTTDNMEQQKTQQLSNIIDPSSKFLQTDVCCFCQ